jgi:DNA damage-binding protein 1
VRHVRTYEVALKDKIFIEGSSSQNNVDNGSGLLIPIPAPLGGDASSFTCIVSLQEFT